MAAVWRLGPRRPTSRRSSRGGRRVMAGGPPIRDGICRGLDRSRADEDLSMVALGTARKTAVADRQAETGAIDVGGHHPVAARFARRFGVDLRGLDPHVELVDSYGIAAIDPSGRDKRRGVVGAGSRRRLAPRSCRQGSTIRAVGRPRQTPRCTPGTARMDVRNPASGPRYRRQTRAPQPRGWHRHRRSRRAG